MNCFNFGLKKKKKKATLLQKDGMVVRNGNWKSMGQLLLLLG